MSYGTITEHEAKSPFLLAGYIKVHIRKVGLCHWSGYEIRIIMLACFSYDLKGMCYLEREVVTFITNSGYNVMFI